MSLCLSASAPSPAQFDAIVPRQTPIARLLQMFRGDPAMGDLVASADPAQTVAAPLRAPVNVLLL